MTSERRGQSLVEFALILPIFVLLLVGVFDVGRAVYAYNTINNAARQAARLAIIDQTPEHVRETAVTDAVSLGLEAADVDIDFRLLTSPDDPGSCDAFVSDGISDGASSGVRRCMAVVRVPYGFEAATPVIGQIMGTLELIGESRFKLEFYCEGPTCPLGD
jgi:Flp pilus assembly protein TadG